MRVTLLTQEACEYCVQAKELLGRLGEEYQLDVEQVDLSTARGQELAEGSGVLFPPGILLDGQPFSYGRPSERRLRRELQRRRG